MPSRVEGSTERTRTRDVRDALAQRETTDARSSGAGQTRLVSMDLRLAAAVAVIVVLAGALVPAPNSGAVSGGRPVSVKSYPWFASVGDDECGAVLIAADRLATSSSCAETGEGSQIRIGRQRRQGIAASFPSVVVDALVRGDRVDCGFAYEAENCDPDIAIVRLSRPVRGVKPLRLARATVHRRGVLVGRGTTASDEAQTAPAKLRAATLNVIADRACRVRYRSDDAALRRLTPAWTFCASDGRPPRDAGICVGDGGAPLIGQDGRAWRLLGIASFATACGEGNWPSVFTDAFALRAFVAQPNPTWRPRTSGSVTITGGSGVGQKLTCHPPTFTGEVDQIIYWFYDELNDRTLQRGGQGWYVIQRGDADVTCWVLAVNRGGVARAVPEV